MYRSFVRTVVFVVNGPISLSLSLFNTTHTHTYAFLALENRHLQLFTLITAANGALSVITVKNMSEMCLRL